MLILQAVPAFDVFSLFVSISTFTVERSWLHVLYTDFTIISTWLQQQQRPFNGLWSGTTRVGRYQKKHSPTHTHPDHRASFKALDYTWFYLITTVLFIPAVFFWGGNKNMVQNCLKPTTASRSTGVPTHGWCHYVGNQMVEVTKPNRNR